MSAEEKCFLLMMRAGEIEITCVEFRIVLNNNPNFGVLLKLSVLLRYGESSFLKRFLLWLEIQWEKTCLTVFRYSELLLHLLSESTERSTEKNSENGILI